MAAACLRNPAIRIPGVRPDASQTPARENPPDTTAGFREEEEVRAVTAIAQWWERVRRRRVFRILKETIRSAEHSLSSDIIRKVCPAEAELLKDPIMKPKLKFRFAGSEFPPLIVFKIYLSASSGRSKYISGKKMIRPASDAAGDARRCMGNRMFYDQLLQDTCYHHQYRVTDEIDVTTMKEYMQYAATVDETPAYLGGKHNTWRKLSLDALPRHCSVRGILELLEHAHSSSTQGGVAHHSSTSLGRLSLEKLQSFTRPLSQTEQVHNIKTVSSLSTMRGGGGRGGVKTPEMRASSSRGSRGSRVARERVRKMRETYSVRSPPPEGEEETQEEEEVVAGEGGEEVAEEGGGEGGGEGGEEGEGSDWEGEASDLYQWSQTLSVDDNNY